MKSMQLVSTLAGMIALSSLLVCEISVANDNRGFSGTLNIGKQYSYLFYFGEQTGDTAVYFFETNSAAGKKILSICKEKSECSGSGSLKWGAKLPAGIPEPSSAQAEIISVMEIQNKAPKDKICSFINANNVNIRKKPNVNAPVIIQLNRGDGVGATSRDGDWVKVVSRESGKRSTLLEGYVFNKYINGCSEDQFDRWRK
jgi:Bacterial SH3 domain